MGQLIDCQMAFVSWGVKARFRQGKVGLLRKSYKVYLVIIFVHEQHKLIVERDSISMMPAAIRSKHYQKDLFIRRASNEERYQTMMRTIKVILRQDELRRTGRGEKLNRLISDIPKLESINLKQQVPARQSTTIVGKNFTGLESNQETAMVICQPEDTLALCGRSDYDGEDKRIFKQRLETYQQLRSIKTIGVRDLPDNLWSADSLNRLALIECNLAYVPKQLETLSRSLQYLDLSRNNIYKLPRTFCCKMNKLRYLNLSNNSIETLPLEIKFFSKLVDLDLSNNRLRLLPSTFSDLRSLKTLNVANNNLSQLPAFGKDDIKLEILDISSNPLDGALDSISTFEVFPALYHDDNSLGYQESAYPPANRHSNKNNNDQQQYLYYQQPLEQQHLQNQPNHIQLNRVPKLFETALLNIVRCDYLFKLASEENLPKTIVSTMQRDVFKCYSCHEMNMLPAYNSTDYLDYVEQVNNLITTHNYRIGMTFMKLLCRKCFGGHHIHS